jgi:hypothetical protein
VIDVLAEIAHSPGFGSICFGMDIVTQWSQWKSWMNMFCWLENLHLEWWNRKCLRYRDMMIWLELWLIYTVYPKIIRHWNVD